MIHKPSRRAAARFVTDVRRKILKALEEEQKKTGLKQTDIARAIEVHRSVINRELRGKKDLTLGRAAELAWAMGRTPTFELPEQKHAQGSNLPKPEPYVPPQTSKPDSESIGATSILNMLDKVKSSLVPVT
jgi:transcriptional regulator with XRE-family HTH domain